MIIFISFRLHKHHFKYKMVIPNKFFAAKWITAKVHGEPAIVSKDEILKILVLIICKEFSVLWTKMLWKTSCGRSWSSLAFILNSNEPAQSLWFSHDPKASGYPHIAFWGHPICPEIIWFGSSSDQANQDLVGWPLTFVWPLSSTTMDLHGPCVFLITQRGQGAPIQHPGGIQFGPNLPVVCRDKFFKRKSRHSWTTFTLFSGLCLQQEWTLLVLCVSLLIQRGLGTPHTAFRGHLIWPKFAWLR